MSLPNVDVIFAPGALLPGNAGPNIDAIMGPCSRGRVGSVQVLVDPNTVSTLLGYGPLAELAAQTLGQTGSSLVCCPATITAGTIPNSGTMSPNRSGSPAVKAVQLLGIRGNPLAPSSANTGNGRATFAASSSPAVRGNTTPSGNASYSSIEIDITTAGAPGAAVMTTKIGGITMQTGVTVPSTTYSVVDDTGVATGLTLDFSVPFSGAFAIGDVLQAVPTQNDGYNVLVTVLSIAANGVAQGTISLDGGVTQSGVLNFLLGGTITATGATSPALTLSGQPTARHKVIATFTRSGTVTGVSAQAGTWPGLLFNQASTHTHVATAKVTSPTSGQVPKIVVTLSGTGTAVGASSGSATGSPTGGSGTADGTIAFTDAAGTRTYSFTNTWPATFIDVPSATTLAFDTGSGNLTSTDVYVTSGTLLSDNGSADGAISTVAVTTATSGAVNVPVKLVITADGTAVTAATSGAPTTGTGTATGVLTIGGNSWTFDTPGGGSGTGGMPSQFTDATTGIVVQIYAGAGLSLHAGDTYGDGSGGSRTTYPVAQFQYTIDGGSPTTTQTLTSGGINSSLDTAFGGTATFGSAGTDLFTYDGTTAANTSVYTFWGYAEFTYNVPESDGSLTGLQIDFPFGTYLAGDTFSIQCVAPSVIPADVETGLASLYAANTGLTFQRIGICAGPATFATVATLASDVQAVEVEQAVSPNYKFNRAFIFGPDLTAATSGATPQDAIDALGLLSLDRVNVTGGADYVVSTLTGRRDLRNCGFAVFPRVVNVNIATDPGYVTLGALTNDFATTTSQTDATAFWDNRVITTLSRAPLTGVYCSGGRSLAQAATTYSVSVYGFLADKLATLTRQFSMPYVNGTVPTVKSGSATTLNPGTASAMNNAMIALISAQMVPALLQNVNVTFSTTADIGNSDPTLPVTSVGLAYPIVRHIVATIQVTL